MQRPATLAALVLSTAVLVPMSAQADVLYREVFPNRASTSTLSQEDNLYANGWYGGNSGDGYQVGQGAGEGGISTNGTGATAQTAVNSNPQGTLSPNSSFAFFSKMGVSNNFFYTSEYSLSLNSIQSITWDSRHNTHSGNVVTTGNGQGSAYETATHLALLIGGNWYVSDTGVTQVGDNSTWHANSLTLASLSWSLCTNGTAGTLPSCSLTGTFGALPGGTVDGFGFWWLRGDGGNGRGTYRFDNVTINGTPAVPEPGSLALAGLALAACAAAARRRQRH